MLTFKFGTPQSSIKNAAARDVKIQTIFGHYVSNLSAPESVRVALDAMQIRGGLAQTGYTGYDYAAQRWIEVEF